jgi:hypothetical protein
VPLVAEVPEVVAGAVASKDPDVLLPTTNWPPTTLLGELPPEALLAALANSLSV